jgi:hypothetical protein
MIQRMKLRIFLKFILLTIMLTVSFQGAAFCDDTIDQAKEYQSLLARLKSGDSAIDYAKLRYSFAKTSEYKPYSKDSGGRAAMFKALDAKDYAGAVRSAEELLAKNYQDMEAHFVCNIAYRNLGSVRQQAFHSTVLKGLLGSLYKSGDGKSPETAFKVISVDEEYFMLNMNGYKTIKQSLVQKDGSRYDRMDVEDKKTGEKNTLYFNVDLPFRWLDGQMKKKE